MAKIFNNLKLLRNDMLKKNWVIDSFFFTYKNKKYIVLVTLFQENEEKPQYALVKLEFLKDDDFSNNLSTYANSTGLFADAIELRKYFGVAYVENLGDFKSQFNVCFSECIPANVIEKKSNKQKSAMILSLNKSDSKDPSLIYCYAVRRNPERTDGTLGQRSPYNNDKTKILRAALHTRLGHDSNLSFLYSSDPKKEKSDEEIISIWTKALGN